MTLVLSAIGSDGLLLFALGTALRAADDPNFDNDSTLSAPKGSPCLAAIRRVIRLPRWRPGA